VLLPEVPAKLRHPFQIGMRRDLALEWLKRLNVSAVSLANNHSHDFGAAAFAAMKRDLEAAGIAVVADGAMIELNDFCLGAATDVENSPAPARDLLRAGSFERWKPSSKPLFALLHCGAEYAAAPTIRERLVASWAEKAGAELIVGAHTHRPSSGWVAAGDRCAGFRWETSSSIKTIRATAAASLRCASSIKELGPPAGCRWGMCSRRCVERLTSEMATESIMLEADRAALALLETLLSVWNTHT